MEKQNVVIVMWHDLGTYLGCYGVEPSPSPHIDNLAAEGVSMMNYFACYPVCCPSRSGMMTGLMPHTNGVSGQINRGWDMRRDIEPLPQTMRNAGYKTYLTSFSHECQDPVWEGFEEVMRVPDSEKPAIADGIFRKHAESGEPFFLTVTTKAVHRPFGDEHDSELVRSISLPDWMPEDECNRIDLACFHRYVQAADAQVGKILAALDESGLAEDTLFIFTTDHGMPFARAKHTQYDPGLHIPLILRWKDKFTPGAEHHELLSNLDFSSTLLELLDLEAPEPVAPTHGRSFAPLLQGQTFAPRGEVFAEHTYGVMYSPSRTIRTDRFKYIVNFEPRTPIMHEPFIVHRCGEDKVNDWFSAPVPPEELYDLDNDPFEMCNLANAPAYGAVRRDLRTRLFSFLESSQDALLEGPIEDPSGEHTPATTIPGEWEADQHGLYHSHLPPIWQRDRFKSRS